MNINAVLLVDRLGEEIVPLNDYACPALLDVAGRKVIEYSLEDLALSGFKEVLVVSAHTQQLEQFAGTGSRWGLELSYLLTRGEESPGEILQRIDCVFPALIVRGDVVRGVTTREFFEAAVNKGSKSVSATQNGRDIGLCLVRQNWVHGASWPAVQLHFATLEIADAGYYALDSLDDFHAANTDIAAGRMPSVTLPGRNLGPGLIAARLSRVDSGSVESGSLFVGRGARVASSARTSETVVVGERALIDEGALLCDSVILPDSYVGKNVELKHAIVAGNQLIRVDTDAVTEVTDDFLLAPLKLPARRARFNSTFDRLLGVVLFIISLPLWPVAALLSVTSNPRSPVVSRCLLSNKSVDDERRAFIAVRWNTSVPILRGLPLLFAVIAGHLRLVGVRPCPATTSDSGNGEVPAGLLGPALTDVGVDAPEEEVSLGELLFIRNDARLKRVRCLFKSMAALVSRRAWFPAAGPQGAVE